MEKKLFFMLNIAVFSVVAMNNGQEGGKKSTQEIVINIDDLEKEIFEEKSYKSNSLQSLLQEFDISKKYEPYIKKEFKDTNVDLDSLIAVPKKKHLSDGGGKFLKIFFQGVLRAMQTKNDEDEKDLQEKEKEIEHDQDTIGRQDKRIENQSGAMKRNSFLYGILGGSGALGGLAALAKVGWDIYVHFSGTDCP